MSQLHIVSMAAIVMIMLWNLLWSVGAQQDIITDNAIPEEFLLYSIKDKETLQRESQVSIELSRDGDHFRWFERREYAIDEFETFHATFNPDTFHPQFYQRSIVKGEDRKTLRLVLQNDKIHLRVLDDSTEIEHQTLDFPDPPFVVEPLLKFYLSRSLGADKHQGDVNFVALNQDKLKVYSIQWQVIGHEKITVEAGEFDCITIQLKPKGRFTGLLNLSSVVWLDGQGTHKIIRSPVRRGLFSKEKIMELSEYKINK